MTSHFYDVNDTEEDVYFVVLNKFPPVCSSAGGALPSLCVWLLISSYEWTVGFVWNKVFLSMVLGSNKWCHRGISVYFSSFYGPDLMCALMATRAVIYIAISCISLRRGHMSLGDDRIWFS